MARRLPSTQTDIYSHLPKVSDKARRRRQYAFVRRGDATPYEAFGGWLCIFDERDHRLTLADILQVDKNALYPLLDAAYKAETGTDPADKNLDKDDRERIKNLHEQTGNFFFAADGLVFSYPPYAVAPFVAGQVELTLPYAQLRGIIKDAYLPQ